MWACGRDVDVCKREVVMMVHQVKSDLEGSQCGEVLKDTETTFSGNRSSKDLTFSIKQVLRQSVNKRC